MKRLLCFIIILEITNKFLAFQTTNLFITKKVLFSTPPRPSTAKKAAIITRAIDGKVMSGLRYQGAASPEELRKKLDPAKPRDMLLILLQ